MNTILLLRLFPSHLLRIFARWFLQRLESHYRICAAVENDKAREHTRNAAYYEKKAVMTKSDWLNL